MELLGDAVERPLKPGQGLRLVLGAEGDMQRRQAILLGDADGRLHQRGAVGRIAQKAPPGCRGEGHGDLKLGVIAPARAGGSLGPAVVKDVFAL